MPRKLLEVWDPGVANGFNFPYRPAVLILGEDPVIVKL